MRTCLESVWSNFQSFLALSKPVNRFYWKIGSNLFAKLFKVFNLETPLKTICASRHGFDTDIFPSLPGTTRQTCCVYAYE